MIIYIFRIRITQTEYLENAQQSACKNYTTKSFGSCLEKEVQNTCLNFLNCVPFWFGEENVETCNKSFNISVDDQINLGSFLADIHVDNVEAFSCPIPCKSISVDAEMVMEDHAVKDNYISIRMSQTMQVIKTRFSFDFLHGFLPAIGGDLGLTRNLLWLTVALMAFFKLSKEWIFKTKKHKYEQKA